jgi:branched-chain amino acid transport system substrate-binding protein
MGEDADLYSAAGFDAMWAYAEALVAAGSAESEAVIGALNDLEDFEGALGVYDWDENRNPSLTGTNLQVQDSEAVLWEPGAACE